MYGKKQKEFNAHICCNCRNWFHKYCLRTCELQPPKKTQDFICPMCKKPATVLWHHPKYTNTCTSDNFLTITLLYCQQQNTFVREFGWSEAELALRASIDVMMKGDLIDGKTLLLDYINSVVVYEVCNQYNCFGSEYGMCLQVFHQVWKLNLSLKCDSKHCPKADTTKRHPATFSLKPDLPFEDQLAHKFPSVGCSSGYLGLNFVITLQKRVHLHLMFDSILRQELRCPLMNVEAI